MSVWITPKRELQHLFSLETKVVLKCFPNWQVVHSNLDKDLVEGNNLLIDFREACPNRKWYWSDDDSEILATIYRLFIVTSKVVQSIYHAHMPHQSPLSEGPGTHRTQEKKITEQSKDFINRLTNKRLKVTPWIWWTLDKDIDNVGLTVSVPVTNSELLSTKNNRRCSTKWIKYGEQRRFTAKMCGCSRVNDQRGGRRDG